MFFDVAEGLFWWKKDQGNFLNQSQSRWLKWGKSLRLFNIFKWKRMKEGEERWIIYHGRCYVSLLSCLHDVVQNEIHPMRNKNLTVLFTFFLRVEQIFGLSKVELLIQWSMIELKINERRDVFTLVIRVWLTHRKIYRSVMWNAQEFQENLTPFT